MKTIVAYTPLHLAVGRKKAFDEAIATLFGVDGIEIDVKNKNGASPLHLAALWGHSSVAEQLLSKGADAKLKTKKKLTPTQMAVNNEHLETARLIAAAAGEEMPSEDTPKKGNKTEVRHVDSPHADGWTDDDQAAFDAKEAKRKKKKKSSDLK
jgi:ankyrin repeat protein